MDSAATKALPEPGGLHRLAAVAKGGSPGRAHGSQQLPRSAQHRQLLRVLRLRRVGRLGTQAVASRG